MPQDTYAVLRLPSFRAYLTARFFVTIASQIQAVAVGWQVYSLTKDPLSLGLIGLAEAIPAISVTLFAGHIADVYNRKRLVFYSLLAMFVSLFGLYALTLSFADNIPHKIAAIYLMVFIGGLARGFLMPANFGLLSQIVPKELYGNSTAWNATLWRTGFIIGSTGGGFLYGFVGITLTYLISVICVSLSIILLFFVPSVPTIKREAENVFSSIRNGLRFVFNQQIILGAITLDLFAVLFGDAIALLPIFSDQILHVGPQGLGLLRAAPALGAVGAAIYLAFRPLTKHAGSILLINVAGFGLCMIAFGFSKSFYFSLLVLAISGCCDSVSVFVRSTALQVITPNNMKGRVSAVSSIFITSSNEIGAFESGVTAKLMGTVPSVLFGGTMTLLVVAITYLKAPKLRDLDLSVKKNPLVT